MDAARDIAIMVLVVQGLVVGLAVFVLGVVGSIAIVETTVNVRRTLRSVRKRAESTHARVTSTVDERVIPPLVRYERARASVRTTIDQLTASLDELRRKAGAGHHS